MIVRDDIKVSYEGTRDPCQGVGRFGECERREAPDSVRLLARLLFRGLSDTVIIMNL